MVEPGFKNGLLVWKLGTFLLLRSMRRKDGGGNESRRQNWAPNFPNLTVEASMGPGFLVRIPGGFYILACILVASEPRCWGFLTVSATAGELTGWQV